MKRLVPKIILEHFAKGEFKGQLQAAVMSIDISGFTSLTEAFLQHREVGAELLTRVLNQLLSPLIGMVYAQGGFVANFAGDSLTAIFPLSSGNDASMRSLLSALSSWRMFAENGIVQTPIGSFQMGVRIGLSRGSVEWGIPGYQKKRTYYFRGPGIESCARAMAHAPKGCVLATKELLDSLEISIDSTPMNGFYRITDAGLKTDIPDGQQWKHDDAELPSEMELSRFAPDRVLDLMSSGASAEFRNVTATFISMEDSLDDNRLNRFVSSVMELSHDYGGHFNKLIFGEKGAVILVLFGAPQTRENDCTRTADFMLALRRREPLVHWMAGSTFGKVYAGLVGCEERCEYTAIGDVVNLAARIAQQKEWGELRLDRDMARRLQDTHELELVDEFSFKGKQEPIPVYRLIKRRSYAEPSFYSGRMVGRSKELDKLREWMDPIFEDRFAGVIYIHGDAGIGKSRLAEEFLRGLHTNTGREDSHIEGDSGGDVQWFSCQTDEILRKSLNPFRHFLRSYFHQQPDRGQEENLSGLDRVLGDLAGMTASSSDPGAGELVSELERTRSFLGALVDLHWPDSLYARLEPKLRFPNTMLALKALFKAESLRKPLVLLMEDIQWLDADSVQLLQSLARNVSEYPIAIICTARYGDDGNPVELDMDEDVPRHAMELRPLEEDGVGSIARNLLKAEISPELSTFVLERTAGNPFFVEQLLLDLRERGALKQRHVKGHVDGELHEQSSEVTWILDRTGSEIPTEVGAVLLARLDRLAARVRHTVQTASVLGREFALQVLTSMLQDEDMLRENVKQAESARVWTALTEFRYLFRHALLRDAAYQMQLRSRLQSLHKLAAEAIEQVYQDDLPPHYSELAYQFGQAGDADRERCYAELAGMQAADAYANQEALHYLGRALELTPPGRARFDLLITRERVFDLIGMRSEQLIEIESMMKLAEDLNDSELKALAVLRRGQYAEDTGDYPNAIESARQCIDIVRRDHPEAESEKHTPEELRSSEDNSDDLKFVPILPKAYNLWGISLMSQGSFDQALEKLGKALELTDGTHPSRQQIVILSNLGMLHALQGGFEKARARWLQGLKISREIDDLLHETAILLNLGNVAFNQDDLTSAGSNWEKALSIFRQIGYRTGAAYALLNLGVLFYQLGSYLEAKSYYLRALSISREIGDRYVEGVILGNLGSVLTQLGQYQEARERFNEALSLRHGIGDHQGEGIVLGFLCHLDLLCGSIESAEKYGQKSLAIASEIGDRPYQARSLTFLGQVIAAKGQLDEAEKSYREALSLYRELGQQGQATESLAGLAQVAMARDLPGKAMPFVQEILTYLETNSLNSTVDPFAVFLTCVNVLNANDDPRGKEILRMAFEMLMGRADKIQDERLRHSFLRKVAVNRRIMELAEAL